MIPPNTQIDRVYSLIIGTEGEAVEINNLNIKFKVIKTSSNKDKKNSAQIEIYNLAESTRKKLEKDYIQVSLSVGYAHTELTTLFSGQVINITSSKVRPFLSKKSGADIITTLELSELYDVVNGTHVSKIVPAGKTVGDAIREIAASMPDGVLSVQMNGRGIQEVLPDGYPLSGNPIHLLDQISSAYNIEWQIDNKMLLVSDVDGTFDNRDKALVPKIGQMSGLIDAPEYINEDAKRIRREVQGKTAKHTSPKANALKLKILLNPTIVAGSIIKLEFADLTGYYKVSEVTHTGEFRGTPWYSELRIEESI